MSGFFFSLTKLKCFHIFEIVKIWKIINNLINVLVKAWFVTFEILLFSGKNEHQILQSAWSIAQRVCFSAMRPALCAMH